MHITKRLFSYFSKADIALWLSSVFMICLSFILFDNHSGMTLIASLLGVTSILLNAKGNPVGQLLMIIFSLLYGIISYSFSYYGEMITYLGMTMPMALLALISWLRHPYKGRKSEVEVNRIVMRETFFMLTLSIVVTVIFYFILDRFHTVNIYPSTLSVTTSFIAVYLTFRRSPYFSAAYALNDVVLIVLWILASMKDTEYISVVVCFFAFLCNDIYAFIKWKAMEKRQKADTQIR